MRLVLCNRIATSGGDVVTDTRHRGAYFCRREAAEEVIGATRCGRCLSQAWSAPSGMQGVRTREPTRIAASGFGAVLDRWARTYSRVDALITFTRFRVIRRDGYPTGAETSLNATRRHAGSLEWLCSQC